MAVKCTIDVQRPFEDPWKFTLEEKGRPTIRAECIVTHSEREEDGATVLQVHWREDQALSEEVRDILTTAIDARLKSLLHAKEYELVRLEERVQ